MTSLQQETAADAGEGSSEPQLQKGEDWTTRIDAKKRELLISRMTRNGQGQSLDGFSSSYGSASNSSVSHISQASAPPAPATTVEGSACAAALKRAASEPAGGDTPSKRHCNPQPSVDGFQHTANRALRTTPRGSNKPSPRRHSIRDYLVAKPSTTAVAAPRIQASTPNRSLFGGNSESGAAENGTDAKALHEMQKTNAQLQSRVTSLEAELKRRVSEFDAATTHLTAKLDQSRKVLIELLIAQGKAERARCKAESDKNCLRLGQFQPKRKGHDFVDTWVEGQGFREVHALMSQLREKKETLDAQKTSLKKAKQQVSAGSGTTAGSHELPDPAAVEHAHNATILGLRIEQLKKEETDLVTLIGNLERDRNMHVRELKRIRDEDTSAYNTFPTLNNRYLLLHLLGRGGFSEVYKAYDLDQMQYVACKIHQLNAQWSDDKKHNYTKHACREYQIHKSLDHPRIVRLLDVFELDDADAFCTVLEYRTGHDLDFHLKRGPLSEKEARSVVCQVMSALRYLNELQPAVIHYDLKPANLLYTDGEVQITDFGLSKVMESHAVCGAEMELTSQGAGTYWYLPPETFVVDNGKPRISSKVDVWSVGVILYQCLYGKRPFGHDLSQQGILQQRAILNAREVVFPPKPVVSNEAKDFIRQCLTYDKNARPDVLTLSAHPYIAVTKLQTK